MAETPDMIGEDRLGQLSAGPRRDSLHSDRRSKIVRSLRRILPLAALVMTVIIITWNDGRRTQPMKKEELIPKTDKAQNELLRPVFNSVDDKNQPYTVTADTAIQNKNDPNIVELQNPKANMTMNNNIVVTGAALAGVYEQKMQKLNLEHNVVLTHSNGYTLSTEELRVDIAAKKAYSGRDVFVKGDGGTINATGLEGDMGDSSLIFTGPAKVVLYNQGSLLPSAGKSP